MSEKVCATCGKPATCFGAYEDPAAEGYACDDCCGHGNEDGWCEPVRVAADSISVLSHHDLVWSAHFDRLTREILNNETAKALVIPINILRNLIYDVGVRAAELNDPVMNGLMVRLAVYAMSDPYDKEYDEETRIELIRESVKLMEQDEDWRMKWKSLNGSKIGRVKETDNNG